MNWPKIHLKGTFYLLLAIACWGTVPLFLRSFIHEIDAWTANGFRYPFSALFWGIPFFFFWRRGKVDPRVYGLVIVPTLINLFSQSLWALAPYYLTPGLQMFFGQASVLFGIAASFLLFQDELQLIYSKAFWAGICLCILGFIGMNVLKGNFQGQLTGIGLAIILAQSFFMGLYGVSVRYYLRGIPPWISFAVICFYTSVGLVTLMLFLGEPSRLGTLSAGRWVVLCISSVIGIALAHVFFYHAIMHVGVSISNGVKLLMPFLTAIGSYFLFQEVFSLGQWLSGVLILLGAGMLLYSQHVFFQERIP